MAIDPHLLADVQAAEGLRLIAYKDTDIPGNWTIGYGHLLEPGIDWTDHEISQDTANALLDQDLYTAYTESLTLLEWPNLDTTCRQNAVIECVFNMGLDRWKGFAHCRLGIMHKDWFTASEELLNSKWSIQVGPRRSHRLAQYLLTGQYPV